MVQPAHRTLPARRTRVIGRERELAEIARRLAVGPTRLLTLTGTAGIGKTTLAVEAARSIEPTATGTATGGPVFVDLTPARDAQEIALRCCEALGLLEQARSPVVLLVEHLVPRPALLVLDNCEHLVRPLRPLLDRLLDRCPDLRILATSRVPLRVRGEAVLPIPPMAVPDLGATDLDGVLASAAVELFVERATAADPGFVLRPDAVRSVAAICRHLEGVPLAVELVAAQATALTPREIEDRLRHRPETATADEPDHGMDATLDWSYDLLSPAAQAMLRRLAVFAGGWTVDAAEHVGALGGDVRAATNALVELVEHSLVVRGWHGDGSRYRMLTPVAEYADRRLRDPTEREAAAMAHATFYLGLVSRPAATFPMSESEQMDLVAAEDDNCEAAMRFAERAGAVAVMAGLALSLLTSWGVRGRLHTAIRRLDSTLAALGPEPSYARGAVLGGLAAYHRLLGQHAAAKEHAISSADVFAEIGAVSGEATAVGLLGEIAADLDDIRSAYAHYDRAWTILAGDPDPVLIAVWHGNVGAIALRDGDLVRARAELDRALAVMAGRDTWYLVQLRARLGRLDRLEGDVQHATAHLVEALGHARRFGARIDGILCLEELARLALDQGNPQRAATLLAAATGIRDATALQVTAYDRRLLVADIERTRAALSPKAFDDAWQVGLGLGLERAMTFAGSAAAPPEAEAAIPGLSPLTLREDQIARLVALGLTNRQIAHRLGIAHGTVRIHVERILGKLGLTSRVQVATWVVRTGGTGDSDIRPPDSA